MEQVAHQTIVMQFILELAKSLKVDPRGCFRQFFAKIKVTSFSLASISFSLFNYYCMESKCQSKGLGASVQALQFGFGSYNLVSDLNMGWSSETWY